MKTHLKITAFLALVTLIIFSCSKEEEKEGCTDSLALNYNVLATLDNGSCEYLDSSFTAWENGKVGFWGNATTGSFEVKSCLTGTSTIFLNPDSTITPADTVITPADTVIDNTVTPPDTTITPADTTITPADTLITGDTYLLVNSDAQGNYELIIQLLNKQSAADFANGKLIFNAKLHPDANINDFDIFIHGNHLNLGGANCATFLQSDPVIVSSSVLDTIEFKEITIPLTRFTERHMQNIDLVFGLKGTNATPNTSLMMIDNVRWVAK